MATRSTAQCTAVLSLIVLSITWVVALSSAYGAELILVHLDSRTGDIERVEHQPGDGKSIAKQRDLYYPAQGFIKLYTFHNSVAKFLDQQPGVAYCCTIGGIWYACHEVKTVIAAFQYDRQRNDFSFMSLNAMYEGKLKELQKMNVDPARRVMRPLTRNYHLVAVAKSGSPAGAEIWVLDESKDEVWK